MNARYIAESLPAYAVIKDWPHHPMTDEGYGVTAPVVVHTAPDEMATRHALALHLIRSSNDADRQKILNAAASAIADGVDAVQISGRVYRIRTVEES